MENTIDITTATQYPENRLKPTEPHSFRLDNKTCCSLESVLQAMKFRNVRDQQLICSSPAQIARLKGNKVNWKTNQKLYWNGTEYRRDSEEYQTLLDNIVNALSTNMGFMSSLNASTAESFTCSELGDDPTQTPMTSEEYCSRIISLRIQSATTEE